MSIVDGKSSAWSGRLIAAVVLFMTVTRSAFPSPVSAQVDTTVVLRIGSVELSSYLVDKYFHRFESGVRQDLGRAPTEQEASEWMKGFLCQHVVVAEAAARGYSDRVEVRRVVELMERYMLTQPHGPFYRSLLDRVSLSREQLMQYYEESGAEIDALVVRFENPALADALSREFAALSNDQRVVRLRGLAGTPGVVLREGPLRWPFEPFGELSHTWATAKSGDWVVSHPYDNAVYFAGIYSATRRKLAPFAEGGEAFAKLARLIEEDRQVQKRRRTLLHGASFTYDGATAARLLPLVRQQLAMAATGVDSAAPEPPATKLMDYVVDGKAVTVSGREFCRWMRDRLAQRPVNSPEELYEMAKDMVVEALDFREAVSAGFSRAPQFVQDRAGFANYQVLDWYEREQLRPKVSITTEEILRYYNGHRDEFTQIGGVTGDIWSFGNLNEAISGIAALREGKVPERPKTVDRNVKLSPNQLPQGLARAAQLLLNAPEGRPVGPIARGEEMVVFVAKERVMKHQPMSEVESVIHARLERQRIEELEHELARQIAPRMPITDRIDYARYHVTPTVAPWSR